MAAYPKQLYTTHEKTFRTVSLTCDSKVKARFLAVMYESVCKFVGASGKTRLSDSCSEAGSLNFERLGSVNRIIQIIRSSFVRVTLHSICLGSQLERFERFERLERFERFLSAKTSLPAHVVVIASRRSRSVRLSLPPALRLRLRPTTNPGCIRTTALAA
jgi:hypothetical protein